MDKSIVVSFKSVVYTILLIVGVYAAYNLRHVFAILVISALIVFALEPLVKTLKNFRLFGNLLGRTTAVIISYVVFISLIAGVFTLGLPPVISQAQKLVLSIPSVFASLNF